jgi:hypothetical protein
LDGIDDELDGFIALSAGRINMHIGREPYFGNEGDASSGNAGGIGLLEDQL